MLRILWLMLEKDNRCESLGEWFNNSLVSLQALICENWIVGLGLPNRHQFVVTPFDFWPAALQPLDPCGFGPIAAEFIRLYLGIERPA